MRRAVFVALCVTAVQSFAQVRTDNRERLYPTLLDKGSTISVAQIQKVQLLFKTIESGILEGDVARFSGFFDKQVFVNITGGESGYLSSGQAASLLQHYMGTRKVLSFKFSRINDKGMCPYATGRLVSIYRGTQESAQVYVSCSLQTKEWVIGQFNIY